MKSENKETQNNKLGFFVLSMKNRFSNRYLIKHKSPVMVQIPLMSHIDIIRMAIVLKMGSANTSGIHKINENRLRKKGESTPFVSYKYDDDGRRIQKTVGDTLTNYHYDGDGLNVLYETNGQNQVVRSYIYSQSGQLLVMKKGTAKYFYHYNAHGDVIALTDVSGNVVASYEYDAWGNPLKVEESAEVKDNPYRYAGYQYDYETVDYGLVTRFLL